MVPPLTRRVGPLVLLSLITWKRADARLLLALACVPHTTAPYETIPFIRIPQTRPQAWSLWTLALVAYVAQWMSGPIRLPGRLLGERRRVDCCAALPALSWEGPVQAERV